MGRSQAARLFNMEVREKKRAANGVHGKTGKRGYVGKMKFPSDFLKGKEKREYQGNGKVVVWNMYTDICEYSYFEGLESDQQKKVLENLRDSFKNKEIYEKWGIGEQDFYRLVNDLDVKKLHTTKRTLTDEELKKWTNDIVDYETFKEIEVEQQAYLFDVYTVSLKTKELAEAWGVPIGRVYNMNYRFKKLKEEENMELPKKSLIELAEEEEINVRLKEEGIAAANEPKDDQVFSNEANVPEDYPTVVEDISPTLSNGEDSNPLPQVIQEIPTVEPEPAPVQPDSQRKYGTTLSFDGEYNQEQLKKKLLTMVELLEDDGRFYKMNISFTEIEPL